MVSTALTINDVDMSVWEAAVAYASSRGTTVGAVVSEALIRYLEDAADVEAAEQSRLEGGRIPWELGRRLFLAESDEEAAAIEEEIAAYEAGQKR